MGDARLRASHHIAAFLPNDGEIDPQPLLRQLLAAGKQCYLPRIGRRWQPRLQFLPWTPTTPLRPNRFQIPEPQLPPSTRRRVSDLDLLLLPLVAFDATGNRLGMGGGFYDRTLAHLQQRNCWRRPLLIGMAFAIQEVEALPLAPWDVPLQGVVTDTGMRWFETGYAPISITPLR